MANEFVARTGLIIKGITSSNISTTYSLYIDEQTGLIAYNTSSIISSGTMGYLPYYTSDGKIIGQASTLYWNEALERLGIGTASPEHTLDVNGSAIIRATMSVSYLIITSLTGSNSNDVLYVDETGNIGITSSLTTSIQSGTAGYIAYYSTNGVTISSSNLYWDNINTRLGIGTASPAYNLDVNGSTRLRGSSSSTPLRIDINSPGNEDVDIINLVSATHPAYRFKLRQIGSNTHLDVSNLHINTSAFANKANTLFIGGTTSLQGAIRIQGAGTNSTVNFLGYSNGTGGRDGGWKVFLTRGIWSYGHSSFPFNPIAFDGNSTDQGIVFNGYSSANAMRVFGSSGNIGIGNVTSDTGYKLQVNGQIYTNYVSSPFLLSNEVAGNSLPTTFISGGKGGGYNGGFILKAGRNADVASNLTQVLRIHRNGSIGVGTDFTDGELQAVGRASINVWISATPSATYSQAYFSGYVTPTNYRHYGIQNGTIMPLLSAGSINNYNSLSSGNTVGMQLGWQYKGLVGGGFDSDFVISGIDSNKIAVEVLRIGSAYQNLMLGRTNSTAYIALRAGTTQSAIFSLRPGATLSTVTAHAIEYDGLNLYLTDTNVTRWRIPKYLKQDYQMDFPSTSASAQATITASFPGARLNDVCVMGLPDITAVQGLFNSFVVSNDLIAVRYHNTSGGAYDPDSMTFSITIMR